MPEDNSTLVYSTNHSVPRKKSGEKTGRHENVEVKNTDTSYSSKLTVRLERKGGGGSETFRRLVSGDLERLEPLVFRYARSIR